MTWQKGQSGNPGGRSKAAAVIAKLIAKETRDGVELVEFALRVMRGDPAPEGKTPTPTDPRSVAYAHTWLTERVAGKAQQVVTLADDNEKQALDFSRLTEAQLDALAELDVAPPAPDEPAAPGDDGRGAN